MVFTNIAHAIAEGAGAADGLLVIIDEFDQIDDPTGFGPFLKSVATNAPKVRFCLVGVAHDIQRLMQQHESSDRLFAGAVVQVPGMSRDELLEIIDIAERSISSAIIFNESARDRLVQLANGHPYMLHLLGKFALRAAHQHKAKFITDEDILGTIQRIAERGGDPALEGRYKRAIASSEQREIVLRSLALGVGEDGEVHTTDAYKRCLEQGVENPSQYVGNLVTQDYGAEIEKVRERFYRFRDSLFHTYVLVRPPYHS